MKLDIKKMPNGDVRLTATTDAIKAPPSIQLNPDQVHALIVLLETAARASVFAFTWETS